MLERGREDRTARYMRALQRAAPDTSGHARRASDGHRVLEQTEVGLR